MPILFALMIIISLRKSDDKDDLKSLHINLSLENVRSTVTYYSSIINIK